MTALDRFIDDLVNDRVPKDSFPKNESSWEELFDFGVRCLDEIVKLGREVARQNKQLIALQRVINTCRACGSTELIHLPEDERYFVCADCGTRK